jgi:hypothetical protein
MACDRLVSPEFGYRIVISNTGDMHFVQVFESLLPLAWSTRPLWKTNTGGVSVALPTLGPGPRAPHGEAGR